MYRRMLYDVYAPSYHTSGTTPTIPITTDRQFVDITRECWWTDSSNKFVCLCLSVCLSVSYYFLHSQPPCSRSSVHPLSVLCVVPIICIRSYPYIAPSNELYDRVCPCPTSSSSISYGTIVSPPTYMFGRKKYLWCGGEHHGIDDKGQTQATADRQHTYAQEARVHHIISTM